MDAHYKTDMNKIVQNLDLSKPNLKCNCGTSLINREQAMQHFHINHELTLQFYKCDPTVIAANTVQAVEQKEEAKPLHVVKVEKVIYFPQIQ